MAKNDIYGFKNPFHDTHNGLIISLHMNLDEVLMRNKVLKIQGLFGEKIYPSKTMVPRTTLIISTMALSSFRM